MRRTAGLVAAALTLALAGCGGADSQDKGSARERTGTLAPGSQSGIPELLTGTWQTTIESSRLVDAPDNLTDDRSVWRLKFLGTGGEDNGPSMFVSNEQVGEIVHSVSLSDDGFTLQSDTDCRRFDYVEIDAENLQFRSTDKDPGCPSTLISSLLQRQWRLVEAGPSRREPTTAEGSLASREAFAECARRRDELGVVVGFRDGRAVPEPDQDVGGAEIYTRVSAPQAIPELLEDGGQYVGLREGVGPDVDIFFHGRLPSPGEDEVYNPLSFVADEALRKGIVSWNAGDYSGLAGDQVFLTVRLEGNRPAGWDEDTGAFRVARALKHLVPCFKQAVRAADRLVPPSGPLGGVWRTDPITVDDMSRTLRKHGLAKWIRRFEQQAPIGKTPTPLSLEIDTRVAFYPLDWYLFAEPKTAPKRLIDYRMQDEGPTGGIQYEQDGDQVVVSHEGDFNAYRWSIDGDNLTLTWEKTTYPRQAGIPEEVFQRALYMTATFKRVG
jgi:hypothetical protein